MNKKLIQTAIVILIWGCTAFLMSIFYYYLKSIGMIWDNPDTRSEFGTWNSRKVIIAIISFSSFIIAIVKIIFIWEDKK
jgi:heme/copper-type cytochrome/quinol oxidase subunit 1